MKKSEYRVEYRATYGILGEKSRTKIIVVKAYSEIDAENIVCEEKSPDYIISINKIEEIR